MAAVGGRPDLEFHYDPAPQRTPDWLARKRGKIGASRMGDWLAVSKAKTGAGKPLKARLDYEKELMFERQFGVSFQTFVSDAMQEGIDFEGFAVQQFMLDHPDLIAAEVGCFYNEYVAESPDRLLVPRDNPVLEAAVAGLEVKIVKDNTFTEILMSGVPDKHYKQVQTGLWATKLKKWYYVALNFNTRRFIVLEVERDEELIDYMIESVQEKLVVEPFTLDTVHEIKGEIPAGVILGADIDRSDSNIKQGDWA